MLGNKLLNIQFGKYHIWNNKSEGFPNMVLSTETFNQSVRTEYSEAVNASYTFHPLWVSDTIQYNTIQYNTIQYNTIHTYLTAPHRGFSGPMKQSTKQQNTTTTTVKNPNWPEANQLAIYKCSWEVGPGTTRNKFIEWSERVLNPGSPDLKARQAP